jgi:hypothetical protein
MSDAYVIWSFEHDAWWGPGRMGYTADLMHAGRYSKSEADAIVVQANRYRPTIYEVAIQEPAPTDDVADLIAAAVLAFVDVHPESKS